MIAATLDHLWQSSLFAAGIALLAAMIRNYRARVRFWLWFAASIKFLVPFAFLFALGSQLSVFREPTVVMTKIIPVVQVMLPAAQPFSMPAPMTYARFVDWDWMLLVIWSVGSAVLATRWLRSWWRLRALVKSAVVMAVPVSLPIQVKETPHLLEPGLVGIFRPTILVPAGIADALSPAEFDTVLKHELCHLQYRDNLSAAVQMMVETLFWFFPVVWWLGRRQDTERERACDEAVLESGLAAEIYAHTILKVCELYLGAPYVCYSRISGADLRQRIDAIICRSALRPLSAARKSLLLALAAVILLMPVAFGYAGTPSALASITLGARPSPGTTEALRRVMAEFQAGAPRYDLMSPELAKRMKQNVFFAVQFLQPRGKLKSLIFSHTDWRGFNVFRAEYAHGLADWLIAPLAQDGKMVGLEFREAYIRNSAARPHTGTSESLRRYIESLQAGAPNYDEMAPELAAVVHQRWLSLKRWVDRSGSLKSIRFVDQDVNGMDVFIVTFSKGMAEWHVAPLTSEGRVSFRRFIPLVSSGGSEPGQAWRDNPPLLISEMELRGKLNDRFWRKAVILFVAFE